MSAHPLNVQHASHSYPLHHFSEAEVAYEQAAMSGMKMQVAEEADFSHLGPNATVNIVISNFVYSPAVVTITKGTTLVWKNEDVAPHTVTASSGGDFDSGFMGKGATYSLTLTQTGSTNYFCAYHFDMVSKIVVVNDPAIPSTPTPTPTPAASSAAPCYASNNNFNIEPGVPLTMAKASGQSWFLIDTVNNLVSYRISYTQVTTTEQRSHIHEFVPSNVTAPARYTLPRGASKIGVWRFDESHQDGLLNGQMHVNIHNANFPSGEIRAQMNTLVPCKRVFTPMVRKK
ncbi:MAG: CHRD domain-containing protein [Anaerolineae bacterium]|nr:CHRD domain-containing protein [Anaerolineae bacterium]